MKCNYKNCSREAENVLIKKIKGKSFKDIRKIPTPRTLCDRHVYEFLNVKRLRKGLIPVKVGEEAYLYLKTMNQDPEVVKLVNSDVNFDDITVTDTEVCKFYEEV